MFEASLNQMALASEDLRKISKELNSCLSDTYGPSGFYRSCLTWKILCAG